MKNPFVQMALMAAAARAIWAEMVAGQMGGSKRRPRRDRSPGKPGIAGSKLARMASEGRIGKGQPR